MTVAVDLDKVAHQQFDVIQGLWAIRMPRQAHALDRAARLRSLRLGRRDSVAAVFGAARLMSVVIVFQFQQILKYGKWLIRQRRFAGSSDRL